MHGGPATPYQVRDREKELKQKFLQMESAIKYVVSPNLSDKCSTI
jgi:hypothetical protein